MVQLALFMHHLAPSKDFPTLFINHLALFKDHLMVFMHHRP